MPHETDHAGHAQEQADDGVVPPSRIAEEFRRRSDVLVSDAGGRVCFGLEPRLRFLQHENDGNDQKRRDDADKEEDPPARIVADETRGRPGGICRLNSEPMMLPSADSAWSDPSAIALKSAGTLSATSVVAAPNMPPMPIPARNR